MVEHRLRLLDVQLGVRAPRFESAVFRDDNPVTENAALRVRTELTAHGKATELVRGREKAVRASFRLGMEIIRSRHSTRASNAAALARARA